MHRFRRHIFRKLARLLVFTVLAGNTAVIWASVDTLLDNQNTVPTSCPMQSMDKHQANGDCCPDSSDCMNYCGAHCPMTASAFLFVAVNQINFNFHNMTDFLLPDTSIPDGISAGLLYRPPIFSV